MGTKTFAKKNIADILALTPMQEGMLFHYLKNPGSGYYSERLSLAIAGEIDVDVFEKAWNFVIAANEMLRTVFYWEKVEKPFQVILKEHLLRWDYHDLSGCTGGEREKRRQEIEQEDRQEGSNLQGVPFRVTLCKTGASQYLLILGYHHILYDGWSNGLILKEFIEAYREFSQGKVPVRAHKPGFKEFIQWNRDREPGEAGKFWGEYLKGIEPAALSIKKRQTPGETPSCGLIRHSFPPGLKDRVENFAREQRITLGVLLYSAWGVLLQKYDNCDDVVFGTTVSGRSAKLEGIEAIVGLLINTLPLRIQSHPGERTIELLHRVQHVLRAREAFEHTSLVEIKEYSDIEFQAELFDTIVVIENYPLEIALKSKNPKEGPGNHLSIESYSLEEKTHYDLTLGITLFDEIRCHFHYRKEGFDDEAIHRLAGHFMGIAAEMVENPEKKTAEIEMLPEEEKKQLLLDFNGTAAEYPREKTLHELFKGQVERTPDHVALVSQGAFLKNRPLDPQKTFYYLTYRQLNEWSGSLAWVLMEKGVQPDTIVGIMVERSIEMIIGIIGILKSGGAYMPIDPDYPRERIDYMLKDSNAKLVVDEKFFAPLFFKKAGRRRLYTSAKQTAYIIYTSGSTGRPKGVPVEHQSLVNYVSWRINAYGFRSTDVTLQLISPAFDGYAANLYPPLLTGGKVITADPGHTLAEDAVKLIHREAVTNLSLVPSLYRVILQGVGNGKTVLKSLRFVVLAGEKAGADLVEVSKAVAPGLCLINEYGPTENTVAAAAYIGMEAAKVSIIGRPVANNQVFVLDRYRCLMPVGVPGELHLSGCSLARGYLNRPELTFEKFCLRRPGGSFRENPWHGQPINERRHSTALMLSAHRTTLIGSLRRRALDPRKSFLLYHSPLTTHHSPIYHTGDLARWLPDGNIEFLGRIDHQVKIRGFRIELGEIENRLLNHAWVKEAVVIARDDPSGEKNLCAYVVLKDTGKDGGDETVRVGLREYLVRVLPGYMIPTYFVLMERMPLTAGGKINRLALPAAGLESIKRTYTPPANDLQKALVGIWGEVLSLDRREIGIDDDFFHMGGHSLKAVSLASRIHREMEVRVSLETIFQAPTIRGLSRIIEAGRAAAVESLTIPGPVEEREYYPLTRNQHSFYMLHRYNEEGVFFNVPLVFPLGGEVDKEKIETVFNFLMRRHESLRTSFHLIGDEPVQIVHDDIDFKIEFLTADYTDYLNYTEKNYKLQNTNYKQIPNHKLQITSKVAPFGQILNQSKVFGSPEPFFQKGFWPPEAIINNFIRPFELTRAPLLRVGLVEPGGCGTVEGKADKYLLIMDMHHLVTDGVSGNILLREFLALYRGKNVDTLAPVTVRYRDYVQWERRRLETGKMRAHEEYWLGKLGGELPIMDMPTDYPRPPQKSYKGDSFAFDMGEGLSESLVRWARETGTTLYMVLLAGSMILWHRITGQTDIIISTPAAARSHPFLEQTIGLVMNSLMMRSFPTAEKSVSVFLREVKQTVLEAFTNQDYPLAELLKKMDYKPLPGRSPIADVELTVLNMIEPGAAEIFRREEGDSRPATHELYFHKTAKLDITISVLDKGSNQPGAGIPCVLEYCTGLFKRGSMERLVAWYRQVLQGIVENPQSAVGEIDIIPPVEKQRLLNEFNDTGYRYSREQTVVDLIRGQSERTPDNVALVGRSGLSHRSDRSDQPDLSDLSITYHELEERSGWLAGWLIEQGVQPDAIVGIMMERSVEMMVGILGILKAGGAYMPIDPGNPQERIDYMLKDSNAKLIVDEKFFAPLFYKKAGRRRLNNLPLKQTNLAYIIYTSGTTGRPKGVMVQHGNLAAYLAAFEREFKITSGDRVLQQASYTFDTFGEEVYPSLSRGGVVVTASERVVKDMGLLTGFLRRHCITIIDCSPLLLNEMNRQPVPGSVRLCISGGDVLRGEYIGNLQAAGKEVYNTYGPTEATVCAAYFKCEPGLDPEVPIGKPISNYKIYILDKGSRIQPVGIGGELCIAGPGVARGYLNNPELTSQKFCLRRPGTFLKKGSWTSKNFLLNQYLPEGRLHLTLNTQHLTLYRTGDLAQWQSDGNIRYLGREDHQVKIRGFRIELPEIEKSLLKYKGIGQVVVAVKERAAGDRYICAYIVPQTGGDLAGGAGMAKELRAYLSQVLPSYMIPAYFVREERIPLTPNGKVNLEALPDPVLSRDEPGTFEAPRGMMEEKLAAVWAGVLGGRQREETEKGHHFIIGIDDNFYELGGDSIKAIQVAARLKEYGLEMRIDDLFRHQTIRSLVQAGAVTKTHREIPQGAVQGEVELTPIQEWFFRHHFSEGHHFNQAVMLYRRQGFDETIVRKVFEKITAHHDALRMVFRQEGDRVIQVNRGLEGERYYLETIILDQEKEGDSEEEVRQEAGRIQAGINLETGPLLRLGLFKTRQGDHLLIAIHHLVIDTVSWRILLEDFTTGYRQEEAGVSLSFPPKTDSFQEWATRLRRYAGNGEIAGQAPYWQEIERKGAGLLPRDHQVEIKDKIVGNNDTIEMILDKENTEKLLTRANRAYNTEINDLLLTALGKAVTGWARTANILITLEGHGREQIIEDLDISRTIGWYTTRYPVLLEMGKRPGSETEPDTEVEIEKELSYRLKQVKEMLRKIPQRGIGYGILKYLAPGIKPGGTGTWDDPDITFNYLGQFHQVNRENTGMEAEVYTLSPLPVGRTHSPRVEWHPALDINGMILEGQLRLSFSYNTREYEKTHLQELVESYRAWLIKIITHCSRKEKRELTLSDLDYRGLTTAEWEEIRERVEKISSGVGIEKVYPLAPLQAGILFHYLANPIGRAYFEQGIVYIRGEIEIDLLKRSIDFLQERHEILRTIFYQAGTGRLVQVVMGHNQARPIEFQFEDISKMPMPGAGIEDYLRAALQRERDRGFALQEKTPVRITLNRTGTGADRDGQTYRMVWNFHHILMDGWCIAVLFKEMMEEYSRLKAGRPVKLPPAPPYRNYIKWLEHREKEKGMQYWQEYLRGYEQPASVTGRDRTGPDGDDFDNDYELREQVFPVEESLYKALNETARMTRVTVNVLLQTAWGILLQRYNNSEDVVFGSVVAGRPAEIRGIEHMVGLFINTVPVRVRRREENTVTQLLVSMQQEAMQSKSYEYLQLAEIQALTPLNRQLLDHIMIFENYPVQKELTGKLESECGFIVEKVEYLEQSNYDFNVSVTPRETGNSLMVKFTFNARRCEETRVKQIGNHFMEVLRQMANEPGKALTALEIVPEEEKKRLLIDFNETAAGYPRDKTIHGLFREQEERTPDHIAVHGPKLQITKYKLQTNSKLQNTNNQQSGAPGADLDAFGGMAAPGDRSDPSDPSYRSDITITYRELYERSGHLARVLIEKGVHPDIIVGIMMERSVDMIIGILGILKAGGAYMPIEPGYPRERIDYMLKDSNAKLIVDEKFFAPLFYKKAGRRRLNNPLKEANNLAYIIYTSGSTGRPKGTLVEQGALVNFCTWSNRYYGITGEERTGHYSSFCFDASVLETFPFLIKGAVIHMIDEETRLDLGRLARFYMRHHITIGFLPTRYCEQFMEKVEECPGLRVLLTGGDKLNRYIKRSYRLYNNYGPTENTVVTTAGPVEEPGDNILIGKPVDNVQVYILNSGSMRLQPVGVPGELCISGESLARGYLNRPGLTSEKFCHRPGGALFEKTAPPNPPRKNFLLDHSTTHHSPLTIYRTGDLAQWRPEGNIRFLGRVDTQVKIRGYRIELGEIENRILRYKGIKEVVVVAREEEGGDKYLCAYIESAQPVVDAEIRSYLGGNMPGYMQPSYFVEMEKMPRNSSGKIDRNALPEPGPAALRRGEYCAPANEKEKLMAEIWSEVLKIDPGQIGVHDDFFRLGGHSLKAMTLLNRIQRAYTREIPLARLFKTPTIRGLCRYIEENRGGEYHGIKPVEEKEYYELSSAQERLYFLDRFETIGTSYHMPYALMIEGALDRGRLEGVFRQLICRHDMLRTSFHSVQNRPVQRVHDRVEFEIKYREINTTWTDREMAAHMENFIRPFYLSEAPLIRIELVGNVKPGTREPAKYLLLLDMHHAAGDGTSMGILVAEFTTLYNGGTLAPLRIRYRDYAEWQRRMIITGRIKRQEEYWLNLYAGEIPRLELPIDNPRPGVFTFEGETLGFSLDRRRSEAIREWAAARGLTLYMALLAVFKVLLAKYCGQEDIIVGSGIAGRNHEDIQDLVGLFVNMLPMRSQPHRRKKLADYLEEIRENTLKAFENQDIQFEDLVRSLGLPRDPSRNPLFDTCFVVQNFKQAELQAAEVTFKPYPLKNKTAKFDLTLFTWEKGEEIHFTLEYCTSLFKPETPRRLEAHFLNIIGQIVEQPAGTQETEIGQLDILTEKEKRQLLREFNAGEVEYPGDKTIPGLFAEQAARTPDYVALVGRVDQFDLSITYRELNEASNRLACYLQEEKGIKPGDRVGIWQAPSLDRGVSVLGVLQAGAAYVPIDPVLPPERVKYMIKDAAIGVVISGKRYLKRLNRLQWECGSFHTYLCMDSDDIYSEDEEEKNELMEEELWHHVGETAGDEITGGGWMSSYTGEPFTREEMDEYGDNILKKLEPLLQPRQRVLEIGCATGITMYRVAPRVGLYYGTDLSAVIIEKNKKRVEQEGHHNIKLAALPAHDIRKIDEKEFDLVIINSVIQCFHGHNYLRKVIRQVMELMGEKGHLLIGDIMDQDKKEAMIRELTAFKNAGKNKDKGYTTKTDFSSELFLSRAFWKDLEAENREIESVEFTGKIHTIDNELTKFRYDAMITINKNPGGAGDKLRYKQKHQEDRRKLPGLGGKVPRIEISSTELAYIIYTSGTAGRPKGVMVEHRSLVNLCNWHRRCYGITSSDHAVLYAGIGFDASVWEFYPYLLTGACLYIIPEAIKLEMEAMNVYYERRGITVAFLPTQVSQQFMELDNRSLRVLLTGGDRLRKVVKRRYALYNNYGPTENTVVTTAGLVEENRENIPIGRPIDNVQVYIVERNGKQLVPVGVAGELCIAGEGIARGYLNNPELTAEKFCLCQPGGSFRESPWHGHPISEKRNSTALMLSTHRTNLIGTPRRGALDPHKSFLLNYSDTSHHSPLTTHHSPIYQSGDLARWQPGGEIEFLGRVDRQVKIRGNRIEPGEIESRILAHEKIKDVVVMDREDENGDKYLSAYIVIEPGEGGEWDGVEESLRNHLAGKLPGYMVPAVYVRLEKIPLTPNGKPDYKALPEPAAARGDYEPPETETEKLLANAWQEVLGISWPGINDNFFKVGGDSIKAIQVTTLLRKEGIELKVSDLFLQPTIKEAAAIIGEKPGEDTGAETDGEVGSGFFSIGEEELSVFEEEFSEIE